MIKKCIWVLNNLVIDDDSGIDVLVHFLQIFFSVLGRFSTFVAILADIFPKSRLVAQKHMGIDASFTKFVLCLRCLKRYLFKDSWHHIGSTLLFIIPGELPVMLFCSSLLNCVLVGRCCILIKSIVTSLSLLLLSSGFVHNCNHWHNRASSRFVRDLYDGKVWKQCFRHTLSF